MEEVLQQALPQLASIEPASERKAAMRERLLARVNNATAVGQSAEIFTIPAEQGEWHLLVAGIYKKRLFRTEHSETYLIRCEPNTTLPMHPHRSHEESYVLEGEGFYEGVRLGPGDLHIARAGTTHGAITTKTGVIFLVRAGIERPHDTLRA